MEFEEITRRLVLNLAGLPIILVLMYFDVIRGIMSGLIGGAIVAYCLYFMLQIWPPVLLYRLSRWLAKSNR